MRVEPGQAAHRLLKQRDQLGRVDHLAGVAIAQQDLACLPEIGDCRCHHCAAIVMVGDDCVWKVGGHIASPCHNRQQRVAQQVGPWL